MPELGLEDLRARVDRIEREVSDLRSDIKEADKDFKDWRHDVLDVRLGKLNAELYEFRRAFEAFMAERKAWAWLPKLVMVAAATIVTGFVAWGVWQLLHLWATVPVKP